VLIPSELTGRVGSTFAAPRPAVLGPELASESAHRNETAESCRVEAAGERAALCRRSGFGGVGRLLRARGVHHVRGSFLASGEQEER
jgi:hypothetical protein